MFMILHHDRTCFDKRGNITIRLALQVNHIIIYLWLLFICCLKAKYIFRLLLDNSIIGASDFKLEGHLRCSVDLDNRTK